MSSPPPVVDPAKEKKGFSKMLMRFKTVMRRDKKKGGLVKADIIMKPEPASEPATTTATATAGPTTTTTTTAPAATVTRIDRATLFAQRSKALSEKFGLEIKAPEWYASGGEALRVEKPIRMRIRRGCHMCSATFGAGKECTACGHVRCADCTRSPPKRSEAEREASRERVNALLAERKTAAAQTIAVDWAAENDRSKLVLKKPSKVPGAPDLVYKKPRQRVRRTCHVCATLFDTGSKKCTKCAHVRCTDCPRDPAKKDKYPFGYPGDEFGPSAIPVHGCHMCKAMFAPAAADGTPCAKCAHAKCPQCLRLKPRKVEPEPDPLVLVAVEAKLAALKVV